MNWIPAEICLMHGLVRIIVDLVKTVSLFGFEYQMHFELSEKRMQIDWFNHIMNNNFASIEIEAMFYDAMFLSSYALSIHKFSRNFQIYDKRKTKWITW